MSLAARLPAQTKEISPGLTVRRLLPSAKRQAIGPFLFFDHFGPVLAAPQDDHDVRPHPHIGLATVTYLFEGAMLHRDSLGTVQRIEPGAINLMTAGRGIVHSERTPDDLKNTTRRSHGLQLWLALPKHLEDCDPSFSHTPAADIPSLTNGTTQIRLLIGQAFDLASPVPSYCPTLYLDLVMPTASSFTLDRLADEMGIYLVSGRLWIDEVALEVGEMGLLDTGQPSVLRTDASARFVIIGGDPLDGPRFMSWNFVSSRKERITQASADWAAQRMPTIAGETEWVEQPHRANGS